MKKELIKSYKKSNLEYYANSNSLHELGLNSRKLEKYASKQIIEVLGLNNYEIIYTSGNPESFTLILNNINIDNIITNSEKLKETGKKMNIENKKIINRKTYSHIDISNINNLNEIDNLNNYDFITIEDELPFFGALIKKTEIELTPIIHGGKSTTKYRSGTSPTPLIVTFSKLIKEKYKK